MSRGLTLPGILSVWAVLACEPTGPPPYGFDRESTQRFVFEAEEQTEIDETPVSVTRYAELALESSPVKPGRTELALRIERYYMRVEGAPGGTGEIALSPQGLLLRDPSRGELQLKADEVGPGGRTIQAILRKAVAGAVLRPDGALIGDPWNSKDPTLQDLPLMEWVLLSLPVIASAEKSSWAGRRILPPLGQYRLGIDMPLRFRWDDSVARRIRSSGLLQRESVTLAEGFRGRLQIDHSGEATLSAAGTLEEAKVELRTSFQPEEGREIRALYRVRLRCAECPTKVNPPPDGERAGG